MTTQRIFASLLAVAGSVSLIAIVPGVALASGGSTSTEVTEEETTEEETTEEETTEEETTEEETTEEEVTEEETTEEEVTEEETTEEEVTEEETTEEEVTEEETTSNEDPTSVPEPGTVFAVGALAMMSVVSIKRRMKR
jgi:outer membrane biosynthesis protein TonB